MLKRSSKEKPSDINKKLAAAIAEESTQETAVENPQKNPAAVALGRLGGLKGGKARAKKLSAKKRKAIAKKAADIRWKKERAERS